MNDQAPGFGGKLGLEMVDMFVGPELKQFKVHDKLLEAIELTIRLPDDNPVVFDLFIEWLYSGSLPTVDLMGIPDWFESHSSIA
ncbi:hypothetical protein BDZ45DRAFT_735387 [Acephala macrosclerotiorum]|nr:hypothetical protein BDZ45DRAFT_735387 [Acephala macrosclerotiorum]